MYLSKTAFEMFYDILEKSLGKEVYCDCIMSAERSERFAKEVHEELELFKVIFNVKSTNQVVLTYY